LILGRIVDADTSLPVAGAMVLLVKGSAAEPPAVTDRDGVFVFFDLPPGEYGIQASKPGYATSLFGQTWAGANRPYRPGEPTSGTQRVRLAEGQRVGSIVVRLFRMGAVTGRITDERGEAIVGTLVQAWPRVFLAGRSWFNWILTASARTDDRGVFRISELVPGDYLVVTPALSVTVPGHADQPAARTHDQPDLNRFRMALGPWLDRGTLNPQADGARAASVGSWWSVGIGRPQTDPGAPEPIDYTTTFYPGVRRIEDARVIRVSGSEYSNIDLQLIPSASRRLAGVVSGPAGPIGQVGLYLTRADAHASGGLPSALAISRESGEFLFAGVEPGAYVLTASVLPIYAGPMRARPPDAADAAGLMMWPVAAWSDSPSLWVETPVSVGLVDVGDLRISLQTGARISGHVRFAGTAQPPSGAALDRMLEVERADGRPLPVGVFREIQINERGEFRSIEFPPGRYFIRGSSSPAPWMMQSAIHDGTDRSMLPIDLHRDVSGVVVTFTDTPSELAGIVTRDGRGDADASVAVITADVKKWTDYGSRPRDLVSVRADTEGRYLVRGLPAGEFVVVAVSDHLMSRWHSAEFFRALAAAGERVQIRQGSRTTVNLTTRSVQ
jgi:hypothetical protein